MIRLKDGFRGERAIVVPKMIVDYLKKDVFCYALYITDIGYYPLAKHHYRERSEPIDQYVLIYCVDGKGWYQVGDTRYDVVANQVFVLPAGVPHSYGSAPDHPWTIYWLHFSGVMAAGYSEGLYTPQDITPTADSRISDRIALFEEMFYTLKAGFNKENLHYSHSILHHFLGSLRYVSVYRNAVKGGDQNQDQDLDVSYKAIHYMKENIDKHLTLQQLADFVGYTPNYLSATFKQRVGHAPLSYFNLLKMQAASQMLDSTGMKVVEIAAKLGYEDNAYFTRLFTKIIGLSPKAYRLTPHG